MGIFKLSQTDKIRYVTLGQVTLGQVGVAVSKIVTTALFTVVCFMAAKPAFALVIKLDGIKDSADTAYTNSADVAWYNDHQGSQYPESLDPAPTTKVFWGNGELEGSSGTEYSFVYIATPLANKNMVWGASAIDFVEDYNQQYSTHHTDLQVSDENASDYFGYDKATGSEKFELNGITAKLKDDSVTGVVNLLDAVSSRTYVLENEGCTKGTGTPHNDHFHYTGGDCAAEDIPMAFEFMFELDSLDFNNLVAFFENPLSKIKTHLSPELGNVDVDVPEPGSLVLLGLGMIGLLGFGRRRAKI